MRLDESPVAWAMACSTGQALFPTIGSAASGATLRDWSRLSKRPRWQKRARSRLSFRVEHARKNASKASANALDKRIAEISEQAVTNLMGKVTRVAVSAATRQQAIEKIINRCRHALITKGFPADSERWSALQQTCEEFVTQSLMIA